MDALHFINITRTFRLQFPFICHNQWELALIIQCNQDNAAQRVGPASTIFSKNKKSAFFSSHEEPITLQLSMASVTSESPIQNGDHGLNELNRAEISSNHMQKFPSAS